MSDHIASAAEVLASVLLRQYESEYAADHLSAAHFMSDAEALTQALDAVGLLATPEHDRKVIEKFLRERDTPSMRIENPEFIAPLLAKAWDEGHTAGVRNASAEFDGPVQDNPYKREGGATDDR